MNKKNLGANSILGLKLLKKIHSEFDLKLTFDFTKKIKIGRFCNPKKLSNFNFFFVKSNVNFKSNSG